MSRRTRPGHLGRGTGRGKGRGGANDPRPLGPPGGLREESAGTPRPSSFETHRRGAGPVKGAGPPWGGGGTLRGAGRGRKGRGPVAWASGRGRSWVQGRLSVSQNACSSSAGSWPGRLAPALVTVGFGSQGVWLLRPRVPSRPRVSVALLGALTKCSGCAEWRLGRRGAPLQEAEGVRAAGGEPARPPSEPVPPVPRGVARRPPTPGARLQHLCPALPPPELVSLPLPCNLCRCWFKCRFLFIAVSHLSPTPTLASRGSAFLRGPDQTSPALRTAPRRQVSAMPCCVTVNRSRCLSEPVLALIRPHRAGRRNPSLPLSPATRLLS